MTKHYVEDEWRTPIEQMEVGDRLTTKSRTLTRSEVEFGVLLAGEYAPQFLSEEAARANGWKTQLVPGLVSLSIGYGLLMQAGFLENVIAYMGTSRMRFPAPVYPGDRIRMETLVTSKKRSENGWVCEYDWVIRNQDGVVVGEGHNV
jgi:acyl dehydratase